MKKVKRLLLLSLLFLLAGTSTIIAQEGFMSRLDFTKEVLSIADIPLLEKATSSFEDVTTPLDISHVETAYKNKIISGYKEFFKPQNPVTHEEAVTIIIKGLGEEGKAKQMPEQQISERLTFKDSSSISPWARPYVAYALSNNIIEIKDLFNPQDYLTHEEGKIILENATKIYDTVLTRDGLTASQMLDQAGENLDQFSTYKFRASTETTSEVTLPSVEGNEENPQKVDMTITQQGIFQKPSTIYIHSSTSLKDIEEGQDIQSEVFMNGKEMYMKTAGDTKWIKFDINPIMEETQKLLGNNQMSSGGLSNEQMELFGMFASFGQDITQDGKDYYVVDVDVDSNTFVKIYKEIIEKTMDFYADMGEKLSKDLSEEPVEEPVAELSEESSETTPEIDQQQIRNQIQQMLENMDISLSYTFYIDKETMLYQDMDMTQVIQMNMDQTKINTHSKAKYTYYDFDGEVTFPIINPEDINTDLQ